MLRLIVNLLTTRCKSLKPPPAPVETNPIVERPKELPGVMWAITTYFNPYGFQTRKANYKEFRQGLLAEGIPLLAVELKFPGGDFLLEEGMDAERLVQRSAVDVMWHKESLLNIALKELPEDCDKVVWLDADILFEEGWSEKTAQALETYCLVQPFSHLIRLPQSNSLVSEDSIEKGFGEGKAFHSFGYGINTYGTKALGNFELHGAAGIMAARREILDTCGFYDASIVGSGDLLTTQAAMNSTASVIFKWMSPAHLAHYLLWATRFYECVQGSVGYVKGTVTHLWHGSEDDKKKAERHSILTSCSYDPEQDIKKNPQGIWCWSSKKFHLHRQVENYLGERRDDG